ncbi:MAG TPA: LysR family transcriptional regulator [Candidatus Binatia bacterium]
MEFRHLRYFIAVAEELHFGRAAARLHLSQPPLSQQIRTLEEELGLKLFSRNRRRVELTHAGSVFLVEAKRILFQMEHAAKAARRAERGQIGPLVVACGPLAVDTVLPPILKTFRAKFPEVDLVLKESTTHGILEALQEKQADVGLLMPHFNSEALQRQTCLTIPMVAALPASHPLARRRRIRLSELADEPFVLFSPRQAPEFHEHALGLCARAGFTPKIVQEAGQHPSMLALVSAGYGVALVPELDSSATRAEVAFVRLRESWAHMQLGVAWRSSASPVLASFLEVVRSGCRAISLKRRWPRVSKRRR